MASAWMIATFLALMLVRTPVCVAMGAGGLVGLIVMDLPIATMVRYMEHDVKSVPLLAIPFFILAGNLMNQLDLTRRIFTFVGHLLGGLRGGMAQANVAASVIFAGISGSALADIAGVGTMVIHAMRQAGYRGEFSAALTVSSSLLAPIIPPSIMFILYAVQMNVSVGHLFVAGVLPGLALAALLMVNNYALDKLGLETFPPPRRSTLRQIVMSGLIGLPALMTPLVILRSMMTGWTTPTEASVLAVVYALLLGVLYREITIERLRRALIDSARTTSMIMVLTGLGSVMGFVLTSEQMAEHLGHALVLVTDDKWVILGLVVLALIVLGFFLETVPALLIGVPLFGPLVVSFG